MNTQEEHAQGLIGDTLVSSAAIAYLGAFTSSYRNRLLSHWLQLCITENIPVSKNFELTGFLSEPIEIQNWLNKGLPHDRHSIENAVLMKHCRRWPLLIDPQEQASHWITQTERDNGLKIVKASDPSYIRTLESAIPLGQPVLVEVPYSSSLAQALKHSESSSEAVAPLFERSWATIDREVFF